MCRRGKANTSFGIVIVSHAGAKQKKLGGTSLRAELIVGHQYLRASFHLPVHPIFVACCPSIKRSPRYSHFLAIPPQPSSV